MAFFKNVPFYLSPCQLLLQAPDLGMLRRCATRRGASGGPGHSALCLPVITPVTQHRGLNTLYPLKLPGHCRLTGRAGAPGATQLIPVLEAPDLDVCLGGLATTDAQ